MHSTRVTDIVFLGILCAGTIAAPQVRAQPASATVAADALFREAKQLMTDGKLGEACPKFAESMRLDPATGTLFALALCHEKQGRLAMAWGEFSEVVPRARRDGRADRERLAKTHVAAIQPKLAWLTIALGSAVASIEGIEVKCNGATLYAPAWGVAIPTDPGEQKVEVTAPGHEAWARTLTLAQAERQTVSLDALPAQAAAAPVAAAPDPGAAQDRARAPDTEPAAEDHSGARRVAAYVSGGVGVVALGLATYFGVETFSKMSQARALCDIDHPCHSPDAVTLSADAGRAASFANVAAAVGVVSLGAAVVLFVTSRSPDKTPRSVDVAASPSGVFVRGTF
jgi:hypothetical protein